MCKARNRFLKSGTQTPDPRSSSDSPADLGTVGVQFIHSYDFYFYVFLIASSVLPSRQTGVRGQQTKLCRHILTDEELARAVMVDSPISTTPLQLRSENESESSPSFDYLSAVGSILHVANCVRPDVSFCGRVFGSFCCQPGTSARESRQTSLTLSV